MSSELPGSELPQQSYAHLSPEQMALVNSMFNMARQGHEEDLLGLIDKGLPVDLANSRGDTLLILAAYNNHSSLVEHLLNRGAEVNLLNDRGQSALTCAVFQQNQETVSLLLQAGANPHHEGQNAYAVAEMFNLSNMRNVLDSHRS